MTSSSEARPSVRLALAEARAMRILAEPTSPSGTKRELSMPARHEEAKATTNGDDFFVTPVAVAIDRTGGHAAMREDILLPLDVSEDAASRLALKLCQETGMAASSAEAIKEQVLEYLAPFREEREEEREKGEGAPSTSGRRTSVVSFPGPRRASSSSSAVVELELDAHCDGVRVRDRLIWDLGDPAPLPAAWAAETARDLGLSARGCAALRAELEAAVAEARGAGEQGAERSLKKEGGGAEEIKRDPGDPSSWLPQAAEDRGGWGDA